VGRLVAVGWSATSEEEYLDKVRELKKSGVLCVEFSEPRETFCVLLGEDLVLARVVLREGG